MSETTISEPLLKKDLEWLAHIIDQRVRKYFTPRGEVYIAAEASPPAQGGHLPYENWLATHALSEEEKIILLLALAPHVQPELLDVFFTQNQQYDREFSEFGGFCAGPHHGFFPTVETALFVLAGGEMKRRMELTGLFTQAPLFGAGGLLEISASKPGGGWFSGRLELRHEALVLLTRGEVLAPDFGKDFPARRISTQLEWTDLVLENKARNEVEEILGWLRYRNQLLDVWDLGRRIRPGYHVLFYGPPGTGKTLCATLLGKACGMSVYRIDLSMVVSKFIGETEKNLARLFDQARNQNWILFFDEADALFGKRTDVRDAHDRYANQEVSYLLQRIEEYEGVVLLASNKRQNFDEAFSRRFQSIVHFPLPRPDMRLEIWKRAIPAALQLEAGLKLHHLADRYELAGGSIMNVIRYAALRAAMRESDMLRLRDFEEGIRREFKKEGKTL